MLFQQLPGDHMRHPSAALTSWRESMTNWALLEQPDGSHTEALLDDFPHATFVLSAAAAAELTAERIGLAAAGGAEFVVGRGGNELAGRGALHPAAARRFTWLDELAVCTTPTIVHEGRVSGLDDGSPSTVGVDGQYVGEWDAAAGRPHGRGTMVWDNGITYTGEWCDGLKEAAPLLCLFSQQLLWDLCTQSLIPMEGGALSARRAPFAQPHVVRQQSTSKRAN